MTLSERMNMPSLSGATEWLNSEPLGPAQLRGRPVLVNFWTFTCINWLRTAPYVRGWSETYRDEGLVVIGIHTPEFSFEHEAARVRQQVKQRGITYPVVMDNNYHIWSAFDNHYWPALYFVDRDGIIRDHHYGEGRYKESEGMIQRLLNVRQYDATVEGVGVEAEADWNHLSSPETYLGYERTKHFASPGTLEYANAHVYKLPKNLPLNHWALDGEWTVGPEGVELHQAGGSIAYRFHARDAHLVLSSASREPIPFRVLLDGENPGPAHGVDIDDDGTGVLVEGRLYQLIRQPDPVKERTIQITLLEAGAEAYVFTFG
jgi:thiol-disulfide isomerase/thioredoxin